MKEIQMFPQITEETEENLLTLDEGEEPTTKNGKSPSPLSSEYSSAVTSPVDGLLPTRNGIVDENLPVPKIVAEYVDTNIQKSNSNNGKISSQDGNGTVFNDEFSSPPPRARMRSLSGGTYRLSPAPPVSGRMRRQSGDDVLTGVSPSRKAAFLDAFRPRSKSDSKGKKPTFLNSFLRKPLFNSQQHENTSSESRTSSPSEHWPRSRSGSESKGSSTVSKVIDMFRSRSNSISIDPRSKKSNAATPGSAFMRRYSVDPERRRHPMITTHRSLELPLDHQHPLHQSLRKRSETLQDIDYEHSPLMVPFFFDACKCDQVMPTSGKVVILEVNLKVEKAFFSLVENAMRAAPVWDSSKMKFIGMLTITDFIDVLLYYDSLQEEIGDFENQKIGTWRSITNKSDKFVYATPNESLAEAVKLLVQEKVHRLPVYDPKIDSVLYCLTYKRILRYFHQWGLGGEHHIAAIFPKPRFFAKSIRELQLGTYENIATATYNTTVIEALKIFRERKVSALPVVENNTLVDIYAKFDAFALATEKSYRNLNITVRKALKERGSYQEPLVTCTLDDTLHCVLDRIVECEVHRIIVVNPKRILVGVISLSDILKLLVLKPREKSSPEKSCKDQESSVSADAESAPQQTEPSDTESIPLESADDDDVFSKPHTIMEDNSGIEANVCSECTVVEEEENLEDVLDKLVIS